MKTKLELEQVLITDATSLVKATELLLSKVEDTYEYECLIDFLQKLYRRYLVWRIAKERVSFEETLWRK